MELPPLQSGAQKIIQFMKPKTILTGAILLFMAQIASGEESVRLKWNLVSALEIEQGRVAAKGATFASESLRPLQEMSSLIDGLKKGKSGQPVSELMTATEAGKFGELRQQQKYYATMNLIVSKRDRDITVLRSLIAATFNEFEWGLAHVSEDNDDKIPQLLAYIDTSLSAELHEMKSVPDAKDAISLALDAHLAAVNKFFAAEVEPALKQFVSAYRARTGKTEISNDSLLPEDRAWGSKLSEFKRYRLFATRLVALKYFYDAMTVANKAVLEESLESGGDIERLGKRFDAKVENEWDPSSRHLMGFYNAMNELVPCSFIRDMQQAVKSVESK